MKMNFYFRRKFAYGRISTPLLPAFCFHVRATFAAIALYGVCLLMRNTYIWNRFYHAHTRLVGERGANIFLHVFWYYVESRRLEYKFEDYNSKLRVFHFKALVALMQNQYLIWEHGSNSFNSFISWENTSNSDSVEENKDVTRKKNEVKIWKFVHNKDEKFNKVSFQSINGLNISEKHILVCTDAGRSNTFTTNTTGKSCDFSKADDFANQKSQTSGRSKKIKKCLAFIQICKLKICMQQNNSVQYASTYIFFL